MKAKQSESGAPKKEPKIRVVHRACEMGKPDTDKWTVVQSIESGLVLGSIGPGEKGGIHFSPDGCRYLLSASTLREIADLIDLHGVSLAS